MILHRICALGHFQSFERTKKDVASVVKYWTEELDTFGIESDHDVLGIEVYQFDIPIDKEGLRQWLNKHYVC